MILKSVRIVVFVVSALLFLCMECPAASREVVVVQSADIRPFSQALEGFEETCDCTIPEVITTVTTSDIVGKIRRLQPDAVLALGMDALTRVQSIRDIPIFYAMTAGARHPLPELTNLAGTSMFIPPERQIDSIKQLFPNAKRIGVIYDPRNTASLVERAIQYARANSLEVVAKKANGAQDVMPLLEGMNGKIDVFLMTPDVTVITPETVNAMLLFSFQNRLPVFTFSEKYVEMGAVAALTVSPFDLGAQTGEIARKVFRDKSNNGMTRTFARKHVLLINAKIAKKLGIVIADEVMKKGFKVN